MTLRLGSRLFDQLLSDSATSALFTDEAELAAMLRFETALARAEERCGVIPAGASAAIAKACETLEPDWDALGRGSKQDGHPVAALVKQLRAAAESHADYIHWGTTAQDVIDTALVLRLREVVAILDRRLSEVIEAFSQHAKEHSTTVMAGRTRSQQAVPITFGLKVAGWIAPLKRHRERLSEIRPRLLVLQFGGAAGTLAALGDQGLAVSKALAEELDLTLPVMPWHTQRDNLAEFASWLSLVTTSLAKVGRDLTLLAQSEIAEVSDGSAGASSTMPQKSNSVLSEILVSAATANATLLGGIHQAALQENERGGSGWTTEWLTLPQMVVLAATALRHATTISGALDVRVDAMKRNLEASNGLLLAEAATFALAAHMPRVEAQTLVAKSCQEAIESGRGLIDILEVSSDAPVDWAKLRDPSNYLGVSEEFIRRVLQ